jgi:hypothetical protein
LTAVLDDDAAAVAATDDDDCGVSVVDEDDGVDGYHLHHYHEDHG